MKEDLAALAEKLCPGAVPVEREHDGFVSVAYVFPMSWSDFLPHRRLGQNGGPRTEESGCVTAYFNDSYFKSGGTPVITKAPDDKTLPRETVPFAYLPFLNLPVADLPDETRRPVMRSRAEEAQPFVDLDVHHTLYARVHEDGGQIAAFEYLQLFPHLAPEEQTMMLVGIYRKEQPTTDLVPSTADPALPVTP